MWPSFVLYIFLFLQSLHPSHAVLLRQEYLALKMLYEKFNGLNWTYGDASMRGSSYSNTLPGSISNVMNQLVNKWDFTTVNFTNPCTRHDGKEDPCKCLWKGLYCSRTENVTHISILWLRSWNLDGEFFDDLFSNFTVLRVVQLSSNRIRNTIPSSLLMKNTLKVIAIDNNTLSGKLHSFLNLHELELLSLLGNNLSGTLPAFPPSIKTLLLGDNSFSGNISQICSAPNLRAVDLSLCKFSGQLPSCVGSLTNLFSLSAFRNKLTGTLNPNLANLEQLEILHLGENSFEGPIPADFQSLTSLGRCFRFCFSNIWATV